MREFRKNHLSVFFAYLIPTTHCKYAQWWLHTYGFFIQMSRIGLNGRVRVSNRCRRLSPDFVAPPVNITLSWSRWEPFNSSICASCWRTTRAIETLARAVAVSIQSSLLAISCCYCYCCCFVCLRFSFHCFKDIFVLYPRLFIRMRGEGVTFLGPFSKGQRHYGNIGWRCFVLKHIDLARCVRWNARWRWNLSKNVVRNTSTYFNMGLKRSYVPS